MYFLFSHTGSSVAPCLLWSAHLPLTADTRHHSWKIFLKPTFLLGSPSFKAFKCFQFHFFRIWTSNITAFCFTDCMCFPSMTLCTCHIEAFNGGIFHLSEPWAEKVYWQCPLHQFAERISSQGEIQKEILARSEPRIEVKRGWVPRWPGRSLWRARCASRLPLFSSRRPSEKIIIVIIKSSLLSL